MTGESVVYKYPLSFDHETWVPDGQVVLVGTQDGDNVTVWVHQPREMDLEQRLIIRGTGHPVPGTARHVGSVICGPYVWHVFRHGCRVTA